MASSFLGREQLLPTSIKQLKKQRQQSKVVGSSSENESSVSSLNKQKKKKKKHDKQQSSADEGSISSPTVKEEMKKKKKHHSSAEADTSESVSSPPKKRAITTESSVEENSGSSPPTKKQKTKSNANAEGASINNLDSVTWGAEDADTLLSRIKEVLPAHDELKFSTREQRLDWKAVAFGPYSPEDCRNKWLKLSSKRGHSMGIRVFGPNSYEIEVRHYRTLTEIFLDVVKLDKKELVSYPDIPKKPVSPYIMFYQKYRKSVCDENPDLTAIECTKLIGKKFNELAPKKRKKYEDKYKEAMEEYRQSYEEFLDRHPECRNLDKKRVKVKASPGNRTKITLPARPSTAMQIYVKYKIEEHLTRSPNDNKKELVKQYQQKFRDLKDNKKLKFINKALAEYSIYQESVKTFRQEHPDVELKPVDHILTKSEIKIKDTILGRPEKPAPNVYAHFTRLMLREPELATVNDKLVKISSKWNTLSDAEKKTYSDELSSLKSNYENDYNVWKSCLGPEDLERVETEERLEAEKQAKLAAKSAMAKKTCAAPKKPSSGMFVFITEKSQEYQKKFPNKPQTEITRMLSRAFQDLPESKKVKYAQKARQGTHSKSTDDSGSDNSNSSGESDSDSDSESSSSSDSERTNQNKPVTVKSVGGVYTSSGSESE